MATSAQAETGRMSRFLIGVWSNALVLIPSGKDGAGWASPANCLDEKHKDIALQRGVTIGENGRITSNAGQWGCLVTELTERTPDLWRSRGPSWQFVARCDDSEDRLPLAPLESPYRRRPLVGLVRGVIELRYAHGPAEERPMVTVTVNMPPAPGTTGIWALASMEETWGPYVRCK